MITNPAAPRPLGFRRRPCWLSKFAGLRGGAAAGAALALVALAALPAGAGEASSDAPSDASPDAWLRSRIERAERAVEAEPEALEARLHLAKLLHLSGSLGDKGDASRADDMLQRLRRAHPDRPRVLAYAGSAMMLRAKRTWLPWKKGDLVEAGGELIERALQRAERTPAADELEVRFVKAVSADSLPGWMGQKETARREFAALAAVAAEAVADGRLLRDQAATVLVRHAERCADEDRTDEARRLYRRAIELSPESHAAARSREALDDL